MQSEKAKNSCLVKLGDALGEALARRGGLWDPFKVRPSLSSRPPQPATLHGQGPVTWSVGCGGVGCQMRLVEEAGEPTSAAVVPPPGYLVDARVRGHQHDGGVGGGRVCLCVCDSVSVCL